MLTKRVGGGQGARAAFYLEPQFNGETNVFQVLIGWWEVRGVGVLRSAAGLLWACFWAAHTAGCKHKPIRMIMISMRLSAEPGLALSLLSMTLSEGPSSADHWPFPIRLSLSLSPDES